MHGFQKRVRKTGGPVRGPGTGTSDSIETTAPQGAYIMPADSTAQIGEQQLGGMGRDVPVNLSNGEYELPPAQVHAIGVQALNGMKDATHEPTQAQGFNPGTFFADGGLVSGLKSALFGPSETTAQKYARQDAELRAKRPDLFKDNPAPAPGTPTPAPAAAGNAIGNYVGNTALDRRMKAAGMANGGMVDDAARRRASMPLAENARAPLDPGLGVGALPGPQEQNGAFMASGGRPAPAPAAAPAVQAPAAQAPARVPGPSELYMQDRTQEMGRQLGQGNYAQAAGTLARTAGQGLGMHALEAADKIATPAANAYRGFTSGLFGADPAASQAAPTSAPPAAPAPAAPNPSDQRMAAGTQTAPMQAPAGAQAPGMGMPTSVAGVTRFDAPGKSPLFTNMPGDDPSNTALMARGAPSAQNESAAQALSDRYAAESRGAAMGASGFNPQEGSLLSSPGMAVIGGNPGDGALDLRDPANLAARNASFDNDVRMQRLERDARLARNPRDRAAALQALQGMHATAGRSSEAGIQDRGATQRNASNNATAERGQDLTAQTSRQHTQALRDSGMHANSNAQQRLDLERTAQGFKSREAQRIESMYQRYDAAKSPEERAAIAKQIRDLSGKADTETWKPVALQGGTDAMGNKTESVMGAVNERTGEMRRYDQTGAGLPPGMKKQVGTSGGKPVYEDANGKRFIGG